jgi:hypothetical protein
VPAFLTPDELEAGLDRVRAAPAEEGTLELIVRRPALGERELLERGELVKGFGLEGDRWGGKSRRNGDFELTVMSARVARLVSHSDAHEDWAQAGDQLYVDFDLSEENLPVGASFAVGETVLEVTPAIHKGCGKFSRRFGEAALEFVRSPTGRALRLRGIHARVVEPGTVGRGDKIRRTD